MKNASLSILIIALIMAMFSCFRPNEETVWKEVSALVDEPLDRDAFNFEVAEKDSAVTSVFRNKSVGQFLFLNARDTSVLVEFYSVKRKGHNSSSSIYQSRVLINDSLVISEVINLKDKSVTRAEFPLHDLKMPQRLYDSEEDCLNDYYESQEYFDLLNYVNRTCKPSPLTGPCCHLKDGRFICVCIIVSPTHLSCLMRDDIAILQSRVPIVFIQI
jgi:hypothetical protein